MKFRIPQFIILSSIFLFSQGCASPTVFTYTSNTNYASLNNSPCLEKSDRILVFFEGEPLNFKYTKLGIVEFSANYQAHDQAKLDYLKNEAWNHCADGIIKINSSYTKGIAVKFDDKNFIAYQTTPADTSFTSYVKKDKEYLAKHGKQENASSGNGGAGFLAFLAIVGLLMIPFLVDSQEDI